MSGTHEGRTRIRISVQCNILGFAQHLTNRHTHTHTHQEGQTLRAPYAVSTESAPATALALTLALSPELAPAPAPAPALPPPAELTLGAGAGADVWSKFLRLFESRTMVTGPLLSCQCSMQNEATDRVCAKHGDRPAGKDKLAQPGKSRSEPSCKAQESRMINDHDLTRGDSPG